MPEIDLNCDMGEGFGDDAALMKYISSANIACGFHAGNEATMRRTAKCAIENNVAIGAHPSFADKEGFGRRNMNLPAGDIYKLITEQISILDEIVKSAGGKLHHVKPHGALYNLAAKERYMADAIAEAISDFDSNLFLYGLANSEMGNSAKKLGVKFCAEVFADRNYERDGSLTPRNKPNALIQDLNETVLAARRMVEEHVIISNDGLRIPVQAGTICIHGDGPHALEFAMHIANAFQEMNIEIKAPGKAK